LNPRHEPRSCWGGSTLFDPSLSALRSPSPPLLSSPHPLSQSDLPPLAEISLSRSVGCLGRSAAPLTSQATTSNSPRARSRAPRPLTRKRTSGGWVGRLTALPKQRCKPRTFSRGNQNSREEFLIATYYLNTEARFRIAPASAQIASLGTARCCPYHRIVAGCACRVSLSLSLSLSLSPPAPGTPLPHR
jgi:hypothetical protein